MPQVRSILCWALVGLLPVAGWSEKYFRFSAPAREIYQLASSLRLEEAEGALAQMQTAAPDNLIALHLSNYIDFYRIYTSEDPGLFQELQRTRQGRLKAIEEGDPASPFYLYVQADIRLQWALLKLKFGDYFAAFNEINRAHRLLKENIRRFPGFLPNRKNMGILHSLVGTVPDQYQWGIRLLSGIEGDVEAGLEELAAVLEQSDTADYIYREETVAIYAYLMLYLGNDPAKAWEIVRSEGLHPEANPLHAFVQAAIALKTGQNDRAVAILQRRPAGTAYHDFPYLEHLLGVARLQQLDLRAQEHFWKFLRLNKGQNHIKATYQKLAWCRLLDGDPEGYRTFMLAAEYQGYDFTDGDQQAYDEARHREVPATYLLKARLLFDGGYYDKALQVLAANDPGGTAGVPPAQLLEHTYRLGRVYQGLGRREQALSAYLSTIDAGRDRPEYYACNAALQVGNLYESMEIWDKAAAFYQTCLAINPRTYRGSLHQAAKTGLSRIDKKKRATR